MQHSDCLQSILRAVYTKSQFNNVGKFTGAFKKHADDVTFGGQIFTKISEVVRKKKALSLGDST